MTSLYDIARKMEVATEHEPPDGGMRIDGSFSVPRPRLEVAMECLGKLPDDLEFYLSYQRSHKGRWWWKIYTPNEHGGETIYEGIADSIEEAVIALCERAPSL